MPHVKIMGYSFFSLFGILPLGVATVLAPPSVLRIYAYDSAYVFVTCATFATLGQNSYSSLACFSLPCRCMSYYPSNFKKLRQKYPKR